jgi:hypothetical protein
MSDPSVLRTICPSCGSKYKWAPEAAGRKFACKCGAVLRMPPQGNTPALLERPAGAATPAKSATPAASVSPTGTIAPAKDEYEIADEAAAHKPAPATGKPISKPEPLPVAQAPAASGRCPSCGQAVKHSAVICVNCGFNLAEGKKLKTDVAVEPDAPAPAAKPGVEPPPKAPAPAPAKHLPGATFASASMAKKKAIEEENQEVLKKARFTDLYLPVGLIILGFIMIVLNAMVLQPMGEAARANSFGMGAGTFGMDDGDDGSGAFGGDDDSEDAAVEDDAEGDDVINGDVGATSGAPAQTTPGNSTSSGSTTSGTPGTTGAPGTTGTTTIRMGRGRVLVSGRSPIPGYARTLIASFISTAIQLPFLVIGMLVVVRLFGTAFGPLSTALLKLFAIAITIQGSLYCLDSFLDIITEGFGAMGWMMTRSFTLAMMWMLSSILFELDFLEMFVLYLIAFLAPILAAAFILITVLSML